MKLKRCCPPLLTSNEERWAAVARRDPDADEQFYYCVDHGRVLPPILRPRLARQENAFPIVAP